MKKLYISILLLVASLTLSAQNLRTGYFLDGYTYRFQFNPAFQGERGFVSLPVVSKTSFGIESTLSVKDFIYTLPSGNLGTFLHPEVQDADVMKNLGKRTVLNTNFDINLLAFGFRVKKTYHTLDLSIKANAEVGLPGDVFKFLKVGASDGNAVYNMADLGIGSDAYAQIAYGFSRRFFDKFNIGLRVKALVGLESIRTDIRNLTLKMEHDEWMVNADGSLVMSSLPSMLLSQDKNVDFVEEAMSLVKKPNLGLAFDIGASVDLFKYLTLSASILDLGFINWNNTGMYTLNPEPWVYTGFNLSSTGSADLESQLQTKLDELIALFNIDEVKTQTFPKYKQNLTMTLHAGAEFRLPFYERFSLAALATHRFGGGKSWTEGRFSANWALLRWFSLAANYAISDYGHSYGGAINLHAKGYSFFLGTDSFRPMTSFATNMIPLNELNTNVVFGMNVTFGKYNGMFPKKDKASKKKNKNKSSNSDEDYEL